MVALPAGVDDVGVVSVLNGLKLAGGGWRVWRGGSSSGSSRRGQGREDGALSRAVCCGCCRRLRRHAAEDLVGLSLARRRLGQLSRRRVRHELVRKVVVEKVGVSQRRAAGRRLELVLRRRIGGMGGHRRRSAHDLRGASGHLAYLVDLVGFGYAVGPEVVGRALGQFAAAPRRSWPARRRRRSYGRIETIRQRHVVSRRALAEAEVALRDTGRLGRGWGWGRSRDRHRHRDPGVRGGGSRRRSGCRALSRALGRILRERPIRGSVLSRPRRRDRGAWCVRGREGGPALSEADLLGALLGLRGGPFDGRLLAGGPLGGLDAGTPLLLGDAVERQLEPLKG